MLNAKIGKKHPSRIFDICRCQFFPDAKVTGESVTNYIQLKAISRSILFDIQGREKIP